jgi:hypothetical protein
MFWMGSQTTRSESDPEAAAAGTSTGSGRLTQRPCPSAFTPSGMSGMGWPCVTTSVRLRPIIRVPRVTMKDGIRALVTMRPATSPKNGPTQSAARMARRMIQASCWPVTAEGIQRTISQPATAADSPTTEPTATSNSPEIMTMVMPAATISITVIWPSRLPMLIGDRKRSLETCMMTTRMARTPIAWMRL